MTGELSGTSGKPFTVDHISSIEGVEEVSQDISII